MSEDHTPPRPLTAPEALAIAKTKGVHCGVRETFAGDGGDDVDLNDAARRIQAIVRAREGSVGQRLRAAGAQRARAAAAKAHEKWQNRSGANRSGSSLGADARPHSDVVLLADSVPGLPNGFGRGRTPGLERNISTESGSPPGERAGPSGLGSSDVPPIATDSNPSSPKWRHDPKTGGLVRVAAYGGSESAEGLTHVTSPVTPHSCGSGQPSPTSSGGVGVAGVAGVAGAGGVAATPSPVQTDAESAATLRRRVDLLERALVATQAALDTERSQCAQWKRCMCEILNGIALNGRMNAKHELKVAQKLEAALRKQEHVETVRYIRCVFPAAAANAPNLQLKRYESLQWSRWDVVWSPCWSIELCLEGHSLFVPFKLVCRVRDLKLRGELTACFPPDLGHVTFSFVELPDVRFEVDSETSIGNVPTPLQRGVSKLIKHQLTKWMNSRVVAPNSMRIYRKIQGSGGGGADGGGGGGGGGAGDEAQVAAAGCGGGDGGSSAGGAASTHGNGGTLAGADSAGADAAGGDNDAAAAAAAASAHESGPTEEELRVAILAALHSKDSRPAGAGRPHSSSGVWRSRRP